MQPYTHPITVYRGDYFSEAFRIRSRVWNQVLNGGQGGWEPGPYRPLTGWSGIFQVRTTPDDTAIAASGTVTLMDQNVLPGSLTYALDAEATATLNGAVYVYDVQLTDETGKPRTFLAGQVTVIKDVSRA